jgi:hypothetical protein
MKDEVEGLIQANDSDERIEMIKTMYPERNLEYSERIEKTWIYQALEYDSEKGEVVTKEGFWDSPWCRFQLAAQRHLAIAAHILTGSSSVETRTEFVRRRHIKAEKE